jgi:hypothetical protein
MFILYNVETFIPRPTTHSGIQCLLLLFFTLKFYFFSILVLIFIEWLMKIDSDIFITGLMAIAKLNSERLYILTAV